MNRDKREYLIIRLTWGHWQRPIDIAEQLGCARRRIAKDMANLNEGGFLKKRGHGPAIHYRLRGAS